MNPYAIGEPRGCSLHPNSPDYDSRAGDRIHDLIADGDELLENGPRDLCRVLSNAPAEHDAAIADLLRFLWIKPALQNPRLRKLAEWLKANDETAEVAAELMDEQADAARAEYADYLANME